MTVKQRIHAPKVPEIPTGLITEQEVINYCFAHDTRTASNILGISEGAFSQWVHRRKHDGNVSAKNREKIIKAFGFEPETKMFKHKDSE